MEKKEGTIQLSEEQMYDMAELFKIFADSTRIKILVALIRSERCVGEIADALTISQPAVSYQLRILKQSKLVRSRREGKQIWYALADDHVKTIIQMAKEHLEE